MSQSLASKFLGILPIKWNLAIRYYKNTKHILHFKNPKRFTEKLQLYKLEKKFPLMAKCHDKYTVHEYVKEKGLGDILVPIYQVAKKSSELDFASLPDKFVMKTTNWGDTNIFCYDKSTFDWDAACKQLDKWLETDVTKQTLEYSLAGDGYIIVEKMLDRDKNNDLIDYRMFCFNGKVSFLQITTEYVDDHANGRKGWTDRDFNLTHYKNAGFRCVEEQPEKPVNYDKMIEIAETLSAGFPHVRVDLYNVDGDIHFAEMTFISGGGFSVWETDEFDFVLGEKFDYYGRK